jgi:hypothetical protein
MAYLRRRHSHTHRLLGMRLRVTAARLLYIRRYMLTFRAAACR